jgi:hypothetical protein
MGYIKNPSDNGQSWRESAADNSAIRWHGFDSKNNGKDKFFKSETLPNDPDALVAAGVNASSGDRLLAGVYGDIPSVNLWTPAGVVTELWLDATDASTITELSGSVSQWDDKSGSGNDFPQGNASRQPITGVRTLNGLNVLDFDGGDSMQRGSLANVANDFIMVGVWDVDSGATLFSETGSPQAWNATTAGLTTQLDGTMLYSGGTISGATVVSFDMNPTGLNAEAFVNGESQAILALTQSLGNSTARIAANFVGGSNVVGGMGEMVISDDRSVETRQKIEGYLAWKWGTESDLPVGHPYKNKPPYITSGSLLV